MRKNFELADNCVLNILKSETWIHQNFKWIANGTAYLFNFLIYFVSTSGIFVFPSLSQVTRQKRQENTERGGGKEIKFQRELSNIKEGERILFN